MYNKCSQIYQIKRKIFSTGQHATMLHSVISYNNRNINITEDNHFYWLQLYKQIAMFSHLRNSTGGKSLVLQQSLLIHPNTVL